MIKNNDKRNYANDAMSKITAAYVFIGIMFNLSVALLYLYEAQTAEYIS